MSTLQHRVQQLEKAVEHGEHVANSAEYFLNVLNENEMEIVCGDNSDQLSAAFAGLRLSIYEFRKRAERCLR